MNASNPAEHQETERRRLEHLQRITAFAGEVEVVNATWSLDEGRMVEFRLCGEAYDRVHPFKQYQQRRNGRMGTRFRASFARTTTGEALAVMDLMLASWKDSSTLGQSIRLWMDNEPDVHPFCGCERRKGQLPGDVFAVVMVELNDDDSAVNQYQRQSVESGTETARAAAEGPGPAEVPGGGAVHREGGPAAVRDPPAAAKPRAPRKMSSAVHLFVQGPLFLRFLQETKHTLVAEWSSAKARDYVKSVIKVQSLSELDQDQEARKRYDDLVRRPYDRWYRQEPTHR